MTTLYMILLLLALICFVAFSAGIVRSARPHLLGLGLAFWVAVPFIQTLQNM